MQPFRAIDEPMFSFCLERHDGTASAGAADDVGRRRRDAARRTADAAGAFRGALGADALDAAVVQTLRRCQVGRLGHHQGEK